MVTDVYPLGDPATYPRAAVTVRYGLYEQRPTGEFINYNVQTLDYGC